MNSIFFYRKRQGSRISDLDDMLHSALCYHDLCRTHTMELGKVSFPAYVFSTWESTFVEKLQSQISAEKQNAFEQITYRDALVVQLRAQIEAEKNNAFEQITYRDTLIARLQSRVESG